MRCKSTTKSADVIVLIVNTTITLLIWTSCICAMPSEANPMFGTPLGKELLKRSKAADIKTWMDPEVDPCTDFYQFACGKWQRINSAQLFGDLTTDQFQDMTKGIQQKVDRLLTEPKTGDFIEDKLRDFYDACRTTKDQEGIYKEALKKVYTSFGQFSYLKESRNEIDNQNSTSDNFNWWSTVAKINRIFGKAIIISVDVLDDVKDKNRTMVYIGPPEFTLTQTAANIMHHLQAVKIYKYLTKYLDIPAQEAKVLASDLMAFETTLSHGATDVRSGKTVDELLTLYNLTDLRTEYSDLFDFEIFLTLALNTTQLPEQVYLYDRTYLQHLIEIFNTTDAGIVEDYILWLLLEEYMVDAREDDLNKWCSEKSKKYFGKFIDYAIYKQYRSAEYEKGIFTLWDEIKGVFRENLLGDHYYWMSNATRKHALEKLENMKLFINSYEGENFQSFFSQLKIDPSNYVANIYNVLQCSESMRLNKLDKKPDGIEEAQVLSFTPVYNSFENSIKIPVALLQPYRLWHPEYPIAMKYATLGFLLAHEMIHGFDDEGRNYDALGHTNNWWDEMSSYEFESRRRCFQAQYHNYTYAGRHLPYSVAQPENIADNAGVKIAYMAYKNWLDREKHNRTDVESRDTFKTLAYNNHELFFISYAQLWCEDVQTLFQRLLATSDNHAPGMYRVIGSLSNFHLFSWIFKCDMKPETPMNPSIKSIPIVYILAIVPGLMPWDNGYRFLSFCHVFGSVAPWCGSFVYHLFMNIERGENVYYTLLKLDMLGIWVSQSFGALPLVTATTFCFSPKWKWLIILSYCLFSLWGLYKALTASSPWQRRLCFALPFTMRSILTFFRTLGVVGGNPVALSHVYLQDGVSIIGGAIGAMRIPEKWFPGLVDFYLNSHNIMHVLVVTAVYSMHKATIKDFEWMSTTNCEAFTNVTSKVLESTLDAHTEL